MQHEDARIVYCTPNTHTRWRVESLYEKEPCTIEWIASFRATDIFVMWGANVDMYSIWSAVTRKARVYAFEPESQNYALLNRNIAVNQLGGQVKAFCRHSPAIPAWASCTCPTS